MRKIRRISLWMISGCLLSQIIRAKDILKRRAVKSQCFAYGTGLLFAIIGEKYLTKIAFSNWVKAYSQTWFYRITIKCWLNADSVCRQTWLILVYNIFLNCIELLKERTDKCQMKPVKLLSDFKASSGHTVIFVCAGERCEVIVEHEQNFISSTSGEGRKSKYY